MRNHNADNRRHEERVSVDIPAYVYWQGAAIGNYRTRNISYGGVSLKPGQVMFMKGMTLEVVFLINRQGQVVSRRMLSLVTHCSNAGMGLKFLKRT